MEHTSALRVVNLNCHTHRWMGSMLHILAPEAARIFSWSEWIDVLKP